MSKNLETNAVIENSLRPSEGDGSECKSDIEKQWKTLICVILDESGSMESKKADTIGGYNEFLEEQIGVKEDKARLFLIKFNTVVSVVHCGVPIEQVPKLTEASFNPGGWTALYDAIAEGVRRVDNEKGEGERVICVIMTDGVENSSKETTIDQVRDIIKSHEANGDWTFVYIGENPEKWARETSMSAGNTVDFCQVDGKKNFLIAKEACSQLRRQQYPKMSNLCRKDN